MNTVGTASNILDAAERITRSVGYNGLSFRDLAALTGIRSASVHYHFPSKAMLGAAMARRYTDRLEQHLSGLTAADSGLAEAMAAYVDVFRSALRDEGRMCLCGILAAEADAVPPEVRAEVRRFVEVNVRWLTALLVRSGDTHAAEARSRALFAALEGAMLVARGIGDIASFDAMAAQLVGSGLVPG